METMLFDNPNGALIKVSIDTKCSKCGVCSASSGCFIEEADGRAVPTNGGCFSLKDLQVIQETEELCPEGAISHRQGSCIKGFGGISQDDLKNFIQRNFIQYKYPRPQYKDYPWTSFRPEIDGKGLVTSTDWEYSSYGSAESAAISELDRVIFDHIDTYIGKALVEYKYSVLSPLTTYEEKENNFYYREKKRMELLLNAFISEIEAGTGKSISNKAELVSVKMIPDFGYNGKDFDSFTKIEDQTWMFKTHIQNAKEYESYIDINSFDVYVGESIFGNSKYATKWAYNAHEAVREIGNDLNFAGKLEMPDYFRSVIDSSYNFGKLVAPIEEEIHKCGEQLLQIVPKFSSQEYNRNAFANQVHISGGGNRTCADLLDSAVKDEKCIMVIDKIDDLLGTLDCSVEVGEVHLDDPVFVNGIWRGFVVSIVPLGTDYFEPSNRLNCAGIGDKITLYLGVADKTDFKVGAVITNKGNGDLIITPDDKVMIRDYSIRSFAFSLVGYPMGSKHNSNPTKGTLEVQRSSGETISLCHHCIHYERKQDYLIWQDESNNTTRLDFRTGYKSHLPHTEQR